MHVKDGDYLVEPLYNHGIILPLDILHVYLLHSSGDTSIWVESEPTQLDVSEGKDTELLVCNVEQFISIIGKVMEVR